LKNKMPNNPLFSVLIAQYNNSKYLQEAIDSVKAQTYTNWEIILVDDASTDNSKELYKIYKNDDKIKIYYNEENKGCGYTKRRCAELANGEICGFLDPDDALLPNALQSMVEVHNDNPSVSVIYSRCYYCDEKLKIIKENKLLLLKEGETYFDYRWYGALHLVTYKKSFYEKTEGISPIIEAGVDQDLYFKIEEVGDIFVLNKFTYYYRKGVQGAITHNWTKLKYWNLEVRRATCIRRNLDIHKYMYSDFVYIIDAYSERINIILSSKQYRVGKILLSPFFLLKKLCSKLLR